MANDMVRTKEPAADVTGQATAAVVGCRFLRISAARTNRFNVLGATGDGNNYRVAHAAAGGPCFGVSKYDQPTIGGKVGVARGGIVTVLAAAALTAGQEVQSDANGSAIVLAAGKSLGYAVDDAANGALAEIALNVM
jgi:hypothetical protein